MRFTFAYESWEDYLYWQKNDKKRLKRINDLLKDISRNPFDGIGKPEALKHKYKGCWSRRIDGEHRLIYHVNDEEILYEILKHTRMAFTYRHIEKDDNSLLRMSLYEALFVADGEELFDISIIDSPDISKYADNWGRIGDFGFLVFDDKEYVGAAWFRLYSYTNKSYGFVDERTPEISIALMPKYRELGIGTELMTRLIRLADGKGYKSISLSVDKRSRAVSFYQNLGFQIIDELDTAFTMIKSSSHI